MNSAAELSAMSQQSTLRNVSKKRWGKAPDARGGGPDETSKDASAQTILEQVWDGLPDLCDNLDNLPKKEGEPSPELRRILEDISHVTVDHPSEELVHTGKNPLIVNSLRDLLYHVGLWFYLLIAGQVVSALWASKLAREHSDFMWEGIFGAQLAVAMLANLAVYLVCRGRLYRDFLRPTLWLVLFTVAPGILVGFAHFMRDLSVPG